MKVLVLAHALVAAASAMLRHVSYSSAVHPFMQPWTCKHSPKGNLNADGILNSADAAIALEMAVGSRQFDDAADVSGDGRFSSLDALMTELQSCAL